MEQAGRDRIGAQQVQRQAGPQVFGHPGVGRRGQAVDADVVLGALDRQGLHKADKGHLGRAVVRLAEIPVQSRGRGGHNDAAIVPLSHDVPDRLGAVDGPHQMDVHDEAEIVQLHLGEGLVAQDAGVVDQDVDPAPFRHRRPDHGLDSGEIGDRGGIGHGLAAGGHDFGHDGLGRGRGSARTIASAPQIIDDHLCAAFGQGEGVFTPQPAAGPRHDRHAPVKSHRHPAVPPVANSFLAAVPLRETPLNVLKRRHSRHIRSQDEEPGPYIVVRPCERPV